MAVSAPNDTPTYAPSPLDGTKIVRGGVFTPANGSPSTYVPPYTGPSTPPPPSPGTIATTGYAQSPLPGAPPTGVYAPSPIDIVIHHESGGKNITQSLGTKDVNNNYGRGGGHPANGYLQIIDPTWQAAARKMGVDINRYPSAQSAPAALQIEVAKTIPFGQWGPSTVAAVKAAYPGINIAGKTLGQIQAEAGGAQPNIPSGSGAGAATTGARPSFADAAQKGDVGAMLQALTAEDAKGKSPLGSLGDNLSQNAGGSARGGGAQASAPMAYPAPQADYAGPAGQLMAQVTQLQNKPLSWSAAPFGSGAGMVPGTTLNS